METKSMSISVPAPLSYAYTLSETGIGIDNLILKRNLFKNRNSKIDFDFDLKQNICFKLDRN